MTSATVPRSSGRPKVRFKKYCPDVTFEKLWCRWLGYAEEDDSNDPEEPPHNFEVDDDGADPPVPGADVEDVWEVPAPDYGEFANDETPIGSTSSGVQGAQGYSLKVQGARLKGAGGASRGAGGATRRVSLLKSIPPEECAGRAGLAQARVSREFSAGESSFPDPDRGSAPDPDPGPQRIPRTERRAEIWEGVKFNINKELTQGYLLVPAEILDYTVIRSRRRKRAKGTIPFLRHTHSYKAKMREVIDQEPRPIPSEWVRALVFIFSRAVGNEADRYRRMVRAGKHPEWRAGTFSGSTAVAARAVGIGQRTFQEALSFAKSVGFVKELGSDSGIYRVPMTATHHEKSPHPKLKIVREWIFFDHTSWGSLAKADAFHVLLHYVRHPDWTMTARQISEVTGVSVRRVKEIRQKLLDEEYLEHDWRRDRANTSYLRPVLRCFDSEGRVIDSEGRVIEADD